MPVENSVLYLSFNVTTKISQFHVIRLKCKNMNHYYHLYCMLVFLHILFRDRLYLVMGSLILSALLYN